MNDDNKGGGPLQVDTDLVRQLAELLNEGDLSEIEVQDGERRIVVKRQLSASYAIPQQAPASAPAAAPPAVPVSLGGSSDSSDVAAASHPGALKSPMVGTAYLAGEPGAKPFVSAGDKVSIGDTLLIVEAMKVMNPITATRAGTVRQVLVVDAQPVEYDQPLMIIE